MPNRLSQSKVFWNAVARKSTTKNQSASVRSAGSMLGNFLEGPEALDSIAGRILNHGAFHLVNMPLTMNGENNVWKARDFLIPVQRQGAALYDVPDDANDRKSVRRRPSLIAQR
jgi:hypothetical protein